MVTQTASILKRLKNEPLRRTIPIHERAIDEKKRTVNLAFASDAPIDHYFGRLILTMNRQAMRSERLSSGAPLLMDHNMTDQIGAVEDFSIAGGVARATVRFSRSVRAEEVFQDVTDGIRRSVSVGFMIHELHLESEKDGEMPVYRSDDWEPYEISLVSVPADVSVGVGRSNKAGDIFMRQKISPDDPADVNVRHNELIEWGGIFGEERLARTMLLQNPDLTREDLRRAIQDKQFAEPQAPLPVQDPHDYAYRFNNPGFSPAVTVPRHGKLEAFKGDRAEERAHAFGQWLLANPFGNRAAAQWCADRGLMTRAQSGLQNEKGGYLVPDQFGNDIVDLVEKYGVLRQHAKNVVMTSDRRTDPVIDGELDSQFVGELEEGDDQDLDFGMIGLTARKHMVLVPMSSEVTEDAAISIADTVAMAAARAFAKKEDDCGFNGDATSAYGGIVGIREKLKSVDGTIADIQGLQVGTGNAYSELTLADFEGVCGRLPDYADMGAKWFVSRKFYFNVMVKLLLATGSPTATEIEDARARKFLGYPVVFSQVMPSTEANSQVCAIFGDLSLGARFGDRRAVTIALDDSILFRKDALLLRATSRFDINVHGVGDTTDAGPICGLITAAA